MGCNAQICHQQPGRIRFRLLDKKGDRVYFEQIEQELLKIGGIDSVKSNHLTGSVLVLHRATTEDILQRIKAHGFFEIPEITKQTGTVTDAVRNSYYLLNDISKRYLGGLDIHSIVLTSLIITGIYQILRGNVGLPVWYVAFWYAMTLVKK
ncbi:MAG: HMA2 domain-containing protein [Thermodesulfovibrionales bacterium]